MKQDKNRINKDIRDNASEGYILASMTNKQYAKAEKYRKNQRDRIIRMETKAGLI